MVQGGFLKELTFIKFYTDKSMNLSPHLKGKKKNPWEQLVPATQKTNLSKIFLHFELKLHPQFQ